MTLDMHGRAAVDYAPCRYGKSQILFRGPKRRAEGRYLAFLGGSETFGRFTTDPFPQLIERQSGLPAINLGCVNAGPDLYLSDPSLIEIAAGAELAVIQVAGAQTVSNRFYSVHPRRNDRFLKASRLMRTIFADVDFTEFNFTRHLLSALEDISPAKFAMLRAEVQEAWVARMTALADRLNGRAVLLWMSRHAPGDGPSGLTPADEPLFITQDMIDTLRPRLRGVIEVVALPEELRAGRAALAVGGPDRAAAEDLLGTDVHVRVAEALMPYIRRKAA